MTPDKPVVELEHVSKRYEGAGAPWVLKDVSLRVDSGEALAVVGPSGSGKSTLLNLIGALDEPSAGAVRLEGVELSSLGAAALAEVRNRRIGFVFQLHHLLPQCTVLENVLVPTLAAGRRDDAGERALRLLKRVGLEDVIARRPGQLSGGERQRAAVVRALINRAPLLLADEPTGALDHASAENLGALLAELNAEEGVTLIVVTHSPDLARRMGRTLQLRDGTLT